MFTSKLLRPSLMTRITQRNTLGSIFGGQGHIKMALMNPSMRTFMTLNTCRANISPLATTQYKYNLLNPFSCANFSIKMDRVRAKMAAKKGTGKYKLKTNKAARKRFIIAGSFHEKKFKYKASNHNHLLRNKSKRNKMSKRKMRELNTIGNIKYMKRLLPYWKKADR